MNQVRPDLREGDVFSVPIGGYQYGLGVISRVSVSGILLGFFFGPARSKEPDLSDSHGLVASDAVLVGRFSDLYLLKKKWRLLGPMEGWLREEWPMPIFVRQDPIAGVIFEVHYADSDPSKFVTERRSDTAALKNPQDGMMGAAFVEQRLTRLLLQ